MRDTRNSALPILVESPSVISLYIRLALLSVLIGVVAIIAGVAGGLLKDHLVNLYRKWLLYL